MSLTKSCLFSRHLGDRQAFLLLIRSLCNYLTDVCKNNLPTLLVFLPNNWKLIEMKVSNIKVLQIKTNKNAYLYIHL